MASTLKSSRPTGSVGSWTDPLILSFTFRLVGSSRATTSSQQGPVRGPLVGRLLWAVWHVPDHFAEEGWGVEALISAPVVFALGFVSLFFARALFVWFYNRTGYSVLLVAIFHASFDAAISQLSYDVVPGSNTARFLIFSGVIVVFATAVIIATKGQLGRAKEAVET
jgi:uncharacterized protein